MPPTLLSQPASEDELAIVKIFFGDGRNCPDIGSFRPFLNFYQKEVAQLYFGVLPALSRDYVTVIRSHQDIIHIAEILRANQNKARPNIRNLLNGSQCRFQSAKNDDIDLTIDLTLRLWLMLNVRSAKPKPEPKIVMALTPFIQWDDATTLQEFVARQFPKEKLDLEPKDSRLSHLFTAGFMAKVCGLKFEFTPRLENHLRLIRRHKTLLVYPHKACLTGYLQRSPYPDELLRETILTLNMLFPDWDPDTNKLLKRYGQDFHEQEPFGGPRTLNLKEFEYWGERLLELYEEVYQSPPVSLQQLWSDRRSPQQWSIFWTAQIILALTIFSCVASFVQAWASVEALQMAQ